MGKKKKKKTKEKDLPPINEEATKVVAAIRARQPGIVESLYDTYRKDFLTWAAWRFESEQEYIEDAWQTAVVVIYERSVSGQLTELRCTVKTFLEAVGKLWLLKNNRKMKRFLWFYKDDVSKAIENDPALANFAFSDDPREEERILLSTAIEKLSQKCKDMMLMRHYEGHSIAEIMENLEYENKATTSASLSTCLKNLKEIIKKMSKK